MQTDPKSTFYSKNLGNTAWEVILNIYKGKLINPICKNFLISAKSNTTKRKSGFPDFYFVRFIRIYSSFTDN